MSERDDLLMESVLGSLDDVRAGPILIEADSTQFVRVNLLLLKALLRERKMPGIFVSVDRPHQYKAHLLRIHGVHTSNLRFLDVIGRFSADRKIEQVSMNFVDTPFQVESLPEMLRCYMNAPGPGPSSPGCTFGVIDNITSLLTYNSYASVERFLRNLVVLAKSWGEIIIVFTLDREKSGLLYETARSLVSCELSARWPSREPPSPSFRVQRINSFGLPNGGE